MDITKAKAALIDSAMRESGLTQSELGEKLGRSQSWISKVRAGETTWIRDSDAAKIEKLLGVTLRDVAAAEREVSSLASRFDAVIEKDLVLGPVLIQLLEIAEGPKLEALEELGARIIQIALEHAGKPEIVASEVVDLIRKK